jgi:NADP-dependent 3-hydroxy acid dehydrogenase YdfG
MSDLADKVVLITGASTGIGRAAAIAFRQQGARVALAARSADALATLARELGGPTWALAVPPMSATPTSANAACSRPWSISARSMCW